MDIVEIFVKNTERLRKELGLTQEALAKKAGVSRSTITGAIAGDRMPGIDTVQKCAEALDTTAAELLTDRSEQKVEPSPLELKLNLIGAVLGADNDDLDAEIAGAITTLLGTDSKESKRDAGT